MTKIKIVLSKLKINEPAMLFWSIIPIVMIIVSTNYIFNSKVNSEINDSNKQYKSQINIDDIEQKVIDSNKLSSLKNKNGAVSLLFVGATKKQFDEGYDVLREMEYVANIAVPTAEVNVFESKMNTEDLLLLQNQGWEVVSQSQNQICDKNLLQDIEVVKKEVEGSKKDLNSLGLYTNIYLAPCGVINNVITNTVKDNYAGLIGFSNVNNTISTGNRYNLTARIINNDLKLEDFKTWISDTKRSNNWIIIAIPDIGDDKSKISIELLRNIVLIINENKINVVTIGQILKYEK